MPTTTHEIVFTSCYDEYEAARHDGQVALRYERAHHQFTKPGWWNATAGWTKDQFRHYSNHELAEDDRDGALAWAQECFRAEE